MAHGVDISHWTRYQTNAPLSTEQLDALENHNVERVVVSIADQDIAREQIESITRRFPKMEIQTYRYYYFKYMPWARENDARFIDELRRNIYNVQFHWIDAEDDNGKFRDVQLNIDETNETINFWAGICRTGMYSAAWVWPMIYGNYTGFSYMPLWFADWDWVEKLTLDPGQEFGGWDVGAMKQTMGDFMLDGVLLCDTIYFEKEPEIVTPPSDLVSVQAEALVQLQAALEGTRISLAVARDMASKLGA